MMATHIEYDQWKYSEVVQDEETKQRVNNIVKAVVKKEEVVVEKKEEKPTNAQDLFSELFGD